LLHPLLDPKEISSRQEAVEGSGPETNQPAGNKKSAKKNTGHRAVDHQGSLGAANARDLVSSEKISVAASLKLKPG